MNDFAITMWACGFLITFIGTTFGIFWKIILGVEKRLAERMDDYGNEKDAYEKENVSKHDLLFSKHDMLVEKSHNFITYKDVSDGFVKKDIYDLQFRSIMDFMNQINQKVDKLLDTKYKRVEKLLEDDSK